MKIWIGTGTDHSYLMRAQPYLDSLKRHEPERATLFCVDFTPGQDVGMRIVPVDFARCIPAQKKMLQVGSFVLSAPPDWTDDDVVVFTDADAILQRPLSDEEIALFLQGTCDGGVMIGRNTPDPTQTLGQESKELFPQAADAQIALRFPGYEAMLARNTGFVVARLGTWRRIHAQVRQIWPLVARTWTHWAQAQMAICYVVQRYPEFTLHDLPLSVHAHGHLGMPPGITFDANGVAMADGKVIFFRHVL